MTSTSTAPSRLALCGYGAAGARVLQQAVCHPLVAGVQVFTHPSDDPVDMRVVADRLGVSWTTEPVNAADLAGIDVVSSVWYRTIIRPPVIDAVGGRIFNLHPSLLPRHRGCSSVPWALIEGDAKTGVTAHYIDPGVDTGRVLARRTTPIGPDDTQAGLLSRCQDLAVQLWPEALERVLAGDPGTPQPAGGCYHRRGAPYDGQIAEDWPEEQVERFIRALTLPPRPYARYRGRPVRSLQEYRLLRAGAGGAAPVR